MLLHLTLVRLLFNTTDLRRIFKKFVNYFLCFDNKIRRQFYGQFRRIPIDNFFDNFFLQFLISLSVHMTHSSVLLLFNRERKAQRKNQMGKFALFQP